MDWVDIWAGALGGTIGGAVPFTSTLLLHKLRTKVARQQRLQESRFDASKDYVRASIAAFRCNETVVNWLQNGINTELVPDKVEERPDSLGRLVGRLSSSWLWLALPDYVSRLRRTTHRKNLRSRRRFKIPTTREPMITPRSNQRQRNGVTRFGG